MPPSKQKPSEIAAEAKRIYIPYIRDNFPLQWPATSYLCYSDSLVAQPPISKLPIRFGMCLSSNLHYIPHLHQTQHFTIVTPLMWPLIGLREKLWPSLLSCRLTTRDRVVIGKQVSLPSGSSMPLTQPQASCRQKSVFVEGATYMGQSPLRRRGIALHPTTQSHRKLASFQRKSVSLPYSRSPNCFSLIHLPVVFRGGPDKYEIWPEMKGMTHLQSSSCKCNISSDASHIRLSRQTAKVGQFRQKILV